MASSFRTHYDNLMVSRTAPPEVITAAYRALSKHLHPDVNPGDPRAERVMRIVNASYAVLSDPGKRKAHDDWIRAEEEKSPSSASPSLSRKPVQTDVAPHSIGKHFASYWGLYIFAGLIGVSFLPNSTEPAASGLPSYVAEPATEVVETKQFPPTEPAYVRPAEAPNGSNWPGQSSYIRGYPIARRDGLSRITIDNSSNSSDMFVKLVALEEDRTFPIRHAYIPANQSFTMNNIRTGQYDVRYKDLNDGSLSRSEPFSLEEIHDIRGVKYSVNTMTLYKVSNGNMQTYPLAPSEF